MITKNILHAWFGRAALFLFVSCLGSSCVPVTSMRAQLTDAEKNWLSGHKTITFTWDPAWQPLDFTDASGSYSGLSSAYLKRAAALAGIKLVPVRSKNWEEALNRLRNSDVDLLPGIVKTPERELFANFTSTYFNNKNIFVGRQGSPEVSQKGGIQGKKVFVTKGFSVIPYLLDHYEGIIPEYVDNDRIGLMRLSIGEGDYAATDVAVASWVIKTELLSSLTISGFIGFDYELRFASRKGFPELASILDKALQLIPKEERQAIESQWVSMSEKPFYSYLQFWLAIAVIILIFILGFAWNFTLRHVVSLRTKELETELERRTNAETALKTSEEKYRTMFENAAEGIFQISPGNRLVTANLALARMYGYKNREALVEAVTNVGIDLFENEEEWLELKETLGQAGFFKGYEARQRRRDGSRFDASFNIHVSPDFHDGTVLYEGFIDDITHKKEADRLELERKRAEAAGKAKDEFLANMSHEIRTPLNAVMGFIQLLAKTPLESRQREFIRKIESAGNSLLKIISDILDLAKIEAGKLSLEETGFSLTEIISHATDIVAFKAEEKGLEFSSDCDLDVPIMLVGDPLRLSQILVNLLSNSVKFTEKGSVRLAVSTLARTEERAKLVFSVIDSGTGMSREQLAQIFNPFIQADASIARRFGGSGLGMMIAKEIITAMGGTIETDSELGTGTSIKFTIEFKILAKQGIERYAMPEDLVSRRILVVEDNIASRETLVEFASDFFSEITAVSSGEEAIALFRDGKRFDLVIIDYKMPGMNGSETIRNIRNRLQGETLPKFIMVTAYGAEEVMHEAKAAGSDAFLLKPLNHSILYNSILSIFGKKKDSWEDTEAPESGVQREVSGASILLVEDNEMNREITMEMLKVSGCAIDTAPDGLKAVEASMEKKYDAILMDLQMPEMDGFAATAEIRKGGPNVSTPIIAMSADVLTSTIERCRKVGMNDHIGKPFREGDLIEKIWLSLTSRNVSGAIPFGDEKEEFQPKGFPVNGLNLKNALDYTGGNRKLLGDIMKAFALKYRGFGAYLTHLEETSDSASLKKEIHVLKGLAGTVGAETLAASCRLAEAAGEDGMIKSIPDLARSLETAITLIEDHLAGKTQRGEADKAEWKADGEKRGKAIAKSLSRLAELVTEGNAGAIAEIERLEQFAGNRKLLESIKAQIEAFDFAAAEKTLERFGILQSKSSESKGTDTL